MSQLHPCSACQRHVRNSETACPFCDSLLAPIPARSLDPSTRLGRAAMFAFRATTVAVLSTLSACGDEQTSPPPTTTLTPPEPSQVVQPYGAPPEPPPPPTSVVPMTDVPPTEVPPTTEVPPGAVSDAHRHRPHHPEPGGPVPLYGGAAMPAYGATPPFEE